MATWNLVSVSTQHSTIVRSRSIELAIAIGVVGCASPSAEAAIITWDSIQTSTTSGTQSVDPITGRTFENDVKVITSFDDAGGETYTPAVTFSQTSFTVQPSPGRPRILYERTGNLDGGGEVTYAGSPASQLSDVFGTPLRIDAGTTNIFRNTVESARFYGLDSVRIDQNDALDQAGVSVLDLGANDGDSGGANNDSFRVRLITGLDINGAPVSYSSYVSVNDNDPFGTGVGAANNINYDRWRPTNTGVGGPFDVLVSEDTTRRFGGILMTFRDFGIGIGDKVYGYEIANEAAGENTRLDLIPSGAVFSAASLPAGALTLLPSPEPELTIPLLCSALLPALLRRRRVGSTA